MPILTPEQLVGRLTDEPDVLETFAAYGLKPNLIEESTKVQSLSRGIELSLHVPWSIKMPEYAGLEKKTKKRPYPRAVVFDATTYAEGTLCWIAGGPAKQEPARAFDGLLPKGISWSDSPASLIERFGPGRFSRTDEGTGHVVWLRWNLAAESRFLMVDATPSGQLTNVVFGLLVKK
jgi:hypothetical protein